MPEFPKSCLYQRVFDWPGNLRGCSTPQLSACGHRYVVVTNFIDKIEAFLINQRRIVVSSIPEPITRPYCFIETVQCNAPSRPVWDATTPLKQSVKVMNSSVFFRNIHGPTAIEVLCVSVMKILVYLLNVLMPAKGAGG